MTIKDLEKMDSYNPTNYVNNSEPDIDAEHLNKTENKLEETVEKANEIIDTLKALISTVQTNSQTTVPSSSLVYSMQQAITKNTGDIATANSNLNDGKYWRAYTTTFAFGREIPVGKDITFDLNISFPARPSVLIVIPSTAKITNVRYDFDNSTETKARIIFDNEGATIPEYAMVRMGIVAIR